MKVLGLTATVLIFSCALSAQNRSGFVSPGNITRTGSSVLFPAGNSATPGVQRTAGSVIYPGGGGAQIGIPAVGLPSNLPAHVGPARATPRVRSGSFLYSYPVYAGSGYYDNSYGSSYAAPPVAPAASGPEQPNVVVIYPPQAPPVIINQYGSGDGQYATRVQPQNVYPMQQPQQQTRAQTEEATEAPHYLLAFKDHSIFSAVAYWVDGDTLHYFTTGSTHNQASVSLIDRELTDRLNRESGAEVKLPPVK